MSNQKTKQCQNCQSEFKIEPEDQEFYQKIQVPEPTFCPECRMVRKFVWRNENILYKRKCDYSGKNIVSTYRKDSPFKVYDVKIWYSDKWDPMDYGMEFNFEKSFFEQCAALIEEVPDYNLRIDRSENCDYCNSIVGSKNCYLSSGMMLENCYFCFGIADKECLDSYIAVGVEKGYENVDCRSSYNIHYCQSTENCLDSAFLFDCRNCQNCFGCVGLRNKKHYIFNQPYSEKEYTARMKEMDIGSFAIVENIKKKFCKLKSLFPRAYAEIRNSKNVVGDHIYNSKNCYYGFDVQKSTQDCKFLFQAGLFLKDSHDIIFGGNRANLLYETTGIIGGTKNLFSHYIRDSYNLQYCVNCFSSSNLFACVGLRHKQYCILNKQYTKEEYEELVPKIKQHMNDMPYTDKQGNIYKYGEFFPPELSPFAYNETIAQEYFPLTEEQAKNKGYRWHKKEKANYHPTIKAKDLPDNIKDTDESIQKEIIECQNTSEGTCQSSGVFRIIPQEYNFLKTQNLPMPRICPDCRHQERIKQRNPIKLWQRQCMCAGEKDQTGTYTNQNPENHQSHKPDEQCPNQFQTSYSPDRKEIVYCEECYQREVE